MRWSTVCHAAWIKLSRLYELQCNKEGYKRSVSREVGNTGEIRRWFHYQLQQDAYDLVHVNSEERLQNMVNYWLG